MREDMPNDIHVVPINCGHIDSVNCFCSPQIDYIDEVTGKRVVAHNETRKEFLS